MLLLGIDSGLRNTGWGLISIGDVVKNEDIKEEIVEIKSGKKNSKKAPKSNSQSLWLTVGANGNNITDGKIELEANYVSSGLIRTFKDKETMGERLYKILSGMEEIIKKHINKQQQFECAIENTYVNSNGKTSIQLAQARAAVIMACHKCGISPITYEAGTIKKRIAGNGRADKKLVAETVNKVLLLNPNIKYKPDVTDALAVAICHALNYNYWM